MLALSGSTETRKQKERERLAEVRKQEERERLAEVRKQEEREKLAYFRAVDEECVRLALQNLFWITS